MHETSSDCRSISDSPGLCELRDSHRADMMKSAPATQQSRSPATGGRHDEGASTHGKKKLAMKKEPKKEQTPGADLAK